MTTSQTSARSLRKPLRLWPGVAAAVLLLVLRFLVPVVFPDGGFVAIVGSLACSLAIIFFWWLFFSRAPWVERLTALGLVAAGMAATRMFLLHPSVVGGHMGWMYFLYSLPGIAVALVVWAVATRRLADIHRRATMAATILIACAAWALVRTDGVMGAGSELHWRWTPTAEQRLLAETRNEVLAPVVPAPSAAPAGTVEASAVPPAAEPAAAEAEAAPAVRAVITKAEPEAAWSGFRGPNRDGVIRGVTIDTDWTASPPAELWRRPIGPGWSSFAVRGDLLYTQEQRGDDELVSAYRVSTGQPVWRHRDAVRFWESNGGAGPRGTPAVSNGRVYAFGATGILNALDADTGKLLWTRNVAVEAGKKVPDWGFSSSPLVVDNVVIIAAASKLAAYDAGTGQPKWFGPNGGGGYSSPHLATLDGVRQVVLITSKGAIGVQPSDGAVLWEHAWPGGTPIMQPALTGDGDLLITVTGAAAGLGTRRISVARDGGSWKTQERWTSIGLKPYFNDFVVHNGHAFGFDGNILACIDLADGTRKWKGGRYGNGQLVLLGDQNLLLIASEEGELVLVSATPDKFTEIAKVPALEGKTWNHPVVIGDLLLVRNGQEMAAFRLPGTTTSR